MQKFVKFSAIPMYYTFVCLVVLLSQASHAVSPTDVFIEARALKNALASEVNQRIGPSLLPLIDIDLQGAKPHHVYALSVAMNEKLGVYMGQNNIDGFNQLAPVSGKISPDQVIEAVKVAQQNFSLIAPGTKFVRMTAKDKKPADVMQEISYANLWVDILLQGKVAPQYPYKVLETIEHELTLINRRLGVFLDAPSPMKYQDTKPQDVFRAGENFYRLLSLSDSMRFKVTNPSHPYDIPSSGVKVKPVDVYTISLFNLYYLNVVIQKMGLQTDQGYAPRLRSDIKPADVLRKYQRVNYLLMSMLMRWEGLG